MNDLQRKILATMNVSFLSTTREDEYVSNGDRVPVTYWDVVRNVKDIDDDYLSERQVVAVIPNVGTETIQGYGDLVSISNYESLLRDYGDYLVVISYYDSEGLGIIVNGLLDAECGMPELFDTQDYLVRDVVSLAENYPLYDESDHSDREYETIVEGLREYVAPDLANDAQRRHGIEIDNDAALWYIYDDLETADAWPHVEGLDVIYNTDSIMERLVSQNVGLWGKIKAHLSER